MVNVRLEWLGLAGVMYECNHCVLTVASWLLKLNVFVVGCPVKVVKHKLREVVETKQDLTSQLEKLKEDNEDLKFQVHKRKVIFD